VIKSHAVHLSIKNFEVAIPTQEREHRITPNEAETDPDVRRCEERQGSLRLWLLIGYVLSLASVVMLLALCWGLSDWLRRTFHLLKQSFSHGRPNSVKC
jgi:hypothetical protein